MQNLVQVVNSAVTELTVLVLERVVDRLWNFELRKSLSS